MLLLLGAACMSCGQNAGYNSVCAVHVLHVKAFATVQMLRSSHQDISVDWSVRFWCLGVMVSTPMS